MSEGTQRRLAAIVSADVVGYSRLMGTDEIGTLNALNAHRSELIDPLIGKHGGRIVKTTGDGLLLEFPSVVAAVECVIAAQEGMAERNAEITTDRAISFRIGVHLGDVIVEGDDIFGDGVNVAARLEGLSEANGVALSDDAYRQVRDRLDVEWQDSGENAVKNIARPVHVWSWSPTVSQERNVGSPKSQALALTDKPSIAVMPFEIGGDGESAFLADGLTEDITTGLSALRWLVVIARPSAMEIASRTKDLRAIGKELNVRYVLTGNVRKSGSRIRVSATLSDAGSARQIWSNRYDRFLEDIFDLQDDLARSISAALAPEISAADLEAIRHTAPENLNAWEAYQRGMAEFHAYNEDSPANAQKYFESVIEHDPNFGSAYSALGRIIWWQVTRGTGMDPKTETD